MKVVIAIFLFTIFCQIGHTRSPAVLPTYGISINEVNKPIPQKPGEALRLAVKNVTWWTTCKKTTYKIKNLLWK